MDKRVYIFFWVAGVFATPLLAGCEPAHLAPSISPESLKFDVQESGKITDLKTKGDEAAAEKTLVLTAEDGETLLLSVTEEVLPPHRELLPPTKAAKIWRRDATVPEDDFSFAVWGYNLGAPDDPPTSWLTDRGTPNAPAKAVKKGDYWRADPDIRFQEQDRVGYYTRWFAIAPYDAYKGGSTTPVTRLQVAASKAPEFTYTYPYLQTVAQQRDLLVAATDARRIERTEPVTLNFVHVLTGIRFKRDKDLAVEEITLSSAFSEAKLDMTKIPADGDISGFTNVDDTGADNDLWANRKLGNFNTYTVDLTENAWQNGHPDKPGKETDYDYADGDKNIMMVIPQLTPKGTRLTVTIGGKQFFTDFSGHRWLPGRLVTYRISNQFSVGHDGVTLESPGFPIESDTIYLDTHTAKTLSFGIMTNLGFTITASDPAIFTSAFPEGNPTTTITGTSVKLGIRQSEARFGTDDPGLQTYKPFTVSKNGKRVYLAPGNLQYRASDKTWRFAPRQWDYVGDNVNGTVFEEDVKSTNGTTPNAARATYDGWIDLFGWGTSGVNYRPLPANRTEYQPWTISRENKYYGPAVLRQGLSGNSDWAYNDIRLGEELIPGGTYRSLTAPEWNYIFSGRLTDNPAVFSYMRAELSLFSRCVFSLTFTAISIPSYSVTYHFSQIAPKVSGVILFPDGFGEDPSNAALAAKYRSVCNGQKGGIGMTEEEWLLLQNAGCIFMPLAGDRTESSVRSVNTSGTYWAGSWGSISQGYNSGSCISLGSLITTNSHPSSHSSYPYIGCAVRLARDAD